jgi:hypothetical protein
LVSFEEHEEGISHVTKEKISHLANPKIPQMADALGGFFLYTDLVKMFCWVETGLEEALGRRKWNPTFTVGRLFDWVGSAIEPRPRKSSIMLDDDFQVVTIDII